MENEAQFRETTTFIIGRNNWLNSEHWNFVINYYRQQDMTLKVCLEIFASKIIHFVYFLLI